MLLGKLLKEILRKNHFRITFSDCHRHLYNYFERIVNSLIHPQISYLKLCPMFSLCLFHVEQL